MQEFVFKRVVPNSLAKFSALYFLYLFVLLSVIDLVIFLATGVSTFSEPNFLSWFLTILTYLILNPIVGYIGGFILAVLFNLTLKTTNGLKLETD